jgi:hypothetical protein
MNSRDRLVMDLERPALTLMLRLLSAGSSQTDGDDDSEMEKTRAKVTGILETFQKEGNVKNFVLDEVTVSICPC